MNKKNTILALLMLCSNIFIGQDFIFNIVGIDRYSNKSIIIRFKNGEKEIVEVKKEGLSKKNIVNKNNSQISRIELTLNLDTIFVKVEDQLFNLGITKNSAFKNFFSDTLNLSVESFPFKNPINLKAIKRMGMVDFPDYKMLIFVNELSRKSFTVIRPEFNLSNHSSFYSNKIKHKVCKCMQDKQYNINTYKSDLQKCLSKPFYNIIPSIDNSLNNYEETQGIKIYSEKIIVDLAKLILDNINLFVKDNCVKN